MAILWIEGFEQFSGGATIGERNINEDQLNRKSGITNAGDNCRFEAGENSDTALRAGRTGELGALDHTLLGGTEGILYISAYLYFEDVGINQPRFFRTFLSGGEQCSIRYLNDGTLQMIRGSGSVVDNTATGTVPLDEWFRFEAYLDMQNSGEWDLRINGASVLSGTGDIQQQASPGADRIQFLFAADDLGLGAGGVMVLDNVVVQDSGGDYLISSASGSWRIEGILPNAVGDDSDFTPVGGANWENVDEVPANDDTNHVQSSTASDRDTYNYEALASLGGGESIYCVNILTTCYGDSSEDLITVASSNGTVSTDAGQTPGSSYVTLGRVMENDPDTAAAWAESAIGAALFGVEVG